MSRSKRRKRIKVKGRYREIVRDSEGRFVSTKKWSSKKRRRR